MDLSPKFGSNKFLCPHCRVASQQTWFDVNTVANLANEMLSHCFYGYRKNIADYEQDAISSFIQQVSIANIRSMPKVVSDKFAVATCSICEEISLWVNEEIVYPKQTQVAPPNSDMQPEIQDLYMEASTIVFDSPKGATALLRLALQLLLKQLGQSGKNINNDIK